MPDASLEALRRLAAEAVVHAHVPYSGRPEAAVLLLADGTWVPGVRVESATFSLTIPALINAFSTAAAAGQTDVVAAVLDHPARPEEAAFLETVPGATFEAVADDAFVAAGASLPAVGARLHPFLDEALPEDPAEGVALARRVAERALVAESDFPVGCVLVIDGRLLPGVNVEHPDWTRILCAERNALGTAASYGLGRAEALYLSCVKAPGATPCGACRQLLVELAPAATLWMDTRDAPAQATPEALLPGAFDGQALHPPGS